MHSGIVSLMSVLSLHMTACVGVTHRRDCCQRAGASNSQLLLSMQGSQGVMQGEGPCMLVGHVGREWGSYIP